MSATITVFVHLSARPEWLALSRAERHRLITEHVDPVLRKHPQVAIRWFDAEAFCARPSDVLMATSEDLQAWTDLFEQLRDSPLWSVPYFDVEAVIPAVEDGFVDYEQRTGR